VFNMVDCLQSERPQRAAASWFSCSEIDALVDRLPRLDVLVLARVRYDAQVARLIAIARAHRVRILFDCDDLVFDIGFVQFILDTLDQDTRATSMFDGWFAYCGRLEAVARQCDGGITTNSFLAARMTDVIRGPASVVPNFLNRYQQRTSDVLLAEKAARGYRGDGTASSPSSVSSPRGSRAMSGRRQHARTTRA
jgi:hypothetical protein